MDIDLDSWKSKYSISGSFEFKVETDEAKEFIGDLVSLESKKLTKEDIEQYIENENVPKGCCVCITKENQIAIDMGDADRDEFISWADNLNMVNHGHYSDANIRDVCSGNYIKTKKKEDWFNHFFLWCSVMFRGLKLL